MKMPNKWTRASAKKWFLLAFPNLKIHGPYGADGYLVGPKSAKWQHVEVDAERAVAAEAARKFRIYIKLMTGIKGVHMNADGYSLSVGAIRFVSLYHATPEMRAKVKTREPLPVIMDEAGQVAEKTNAAIAANG